ncbi:MAG: hypothetical protein HRU01_28615 [Myxococcales bacterium]|nr:hypothetical protein [Myxococcales bacterium]
MNTGSRGTNVSLYFLDVLACLLFCLAIALAGAHFGREHSVDLELPVATPTEASGESLGSTEIHVWMEEGVEIIELDGVRMSAVDLERALRATAPGSVLIRATASPLSRVVGFAHAAGVRNIELAYRSESEAGGSARGTGRAAR